MFAPSDEKLVRRAIDNNRQAWLHLVKRYEGLVYNYALRMSGNRDDALDLMQDVFLSLFRNLASWRGESSFKNWLMKIAHYRCIEHFRSRRNFADEHDFDQQESHLDWHDPEAVYQGQQRTQQLVQAMQALPLEQRLVVELKFFQHLRLKDISEQLEVPLNTVKSRLYKAVERLQQLVEEL
ncbi:RNA polymerase subunit sigma-70 [Pseudidiomarina sediminum]|uniref:RNA polymerase subunit sigma-70 n=1 Tax=Pseudidiomarina sediminum TaxID=431675 RepID=A0A432Z0R9_9GAMM|nr:sigma-70 family RNA polymerase sigma factor [Pseudidiomarina sediminum]RUO69788.1 RNA polymerase subunit sigma-70 [Pseudidiomarina sediminum]